MKLIRTRTWNKNNRSEKIKRIVAALNRSGKVEVEYFRGRSWVLTVLSGRGRPRPVNENDEWNQMKVTYLEKDAFEMFYSGFGCDGRLYDENFTEVEIKQITNALAGAEVVMQETFMRINRCVRLLCIPALLGGFLGVIDGCIYGNFETVFKFSTFILVFLITLRTTYWERF